MNYECQMGKYTISTDKSRLQVDVIQDYLANRSYWAKGRLVEVTRRSIENSLCFGVYDGESQVGFARLVSDYATMAWLCDVFVLEAARGQGLGKWLVKCVVNHPDVKPLKRIYLATNDAHELYRQYGGFELLAHPERFMILDRQVSQ
jgi:GNAT superfamily N-acetyltransferase